MENTMTIIYRLNEGAKLRAKAKRPHQQETSENNIHVLFREFANGFFTHDMAVQALKLETFMPVTSVHLMIQDGVILRVGETYHNV